MSHHFSESVLAQFQAEADRIFRRDAGDPYAVQVPGYPPARLRAASLSDAVWKYFRLCGLVFPNCGFNAYRVADFADPETPRPHSPVFPDVIAGCDAR